MIVASKSPGTTASAVSSRSGTFDLTSSRSGSFDTAPFVLPAQCYICQGKFSTKLHSVLQLCDCPVAVCQLCAIHRMILNEEFALDCLICGNKVTPSPNINIIRNVAKVKELVSKYIERACQYYRIPMPSIIDPTVTQFYPLLTRFEKDTVLSSYLIEFRKTDRDNSFDESEENSNTNAQRRKLNANYLKLQLARVEHLRAGPIQEMEEIDLFHVGNIAIEEKEGNLPLGPLKALFLVKNVYLEKLLELDDDATNIDPTCMVCHDPIQQGGSVLLSCNCEVLTCRGCAIKGLISSKHTYRKGIYCPSCSKNSMISLSNYEKAKEEEESIVAAIVRQHSSKESSCSSKSIVDLRKLLQHLYDSGAAPNLPSTMKTKDAIHALSFHQIELQLSRIYVSLERKKTRHERIIKKEKKSLTKRSSAEEDAEFDEMGMKSKKGSGGNTKGNKKKGEKEDDFQVDQVIAYENKADELYFYEESHQDQGYDLPIGPLRLLRFRTNPYVELYLANASNAHNETFVTSAENARVSSPSLSKMRSLFDAFHPPFNTICPKCTVNPQNLECLRMHLKTVHNVVRKDEIDKFMKLVVLQPAEFDTIASSSLRSMKSVGLDANQNISVASSSNNLSIDVSPDFILISKHEL